MSFVLDTSISLAWCFEAEQTAPIMALLGRVLESGAVAPNLWPIETLNGLLVAERRQRINATTRYRLAGYLRDLPIEIDDETLGRIWTDTSRLAETHGLTAYDATYLELAIRLSLPLATADRALMAAARQMQVPLLPS